MAYEEPIVKKVVIIGDGTCGKTSLLTVYKGDVFPQKYIPTIFENSAKRVEHDGKVVQLMMWDTAGQEEYKALRHLAYEDTDVVLIAFSIDNRDSFENIQKAWYPEYQKHMKGTQIVLVGTKSDLKEDSALEEASVTLEEGTELAKSINAFCYCECSAKTSFGIKEVFEEAIKASFREKTSPSSPLSCCKLM
eukprot:GFUD01002109.1.p1 GENE.GFUD01002109.1~~GFUD01002109.1.p1  ORF type:complete len:192 (+),score=51.22 GFUD01002109.1:45-620(+)